MRLGSQIQSWMRAVMGRARMESDMDAELRFHMETYADDLDHPRVVVIDETLARRFFPNEDPIGKHLQVPDATRPAREIVGIVGGVRDTGFDQQPRPTIYFPSLQSPDQTMSLVVRTSLPPGAILPAIKSAIWSVDNRCSM